MKITAIGCRIVAPAADPKDKRADEDGNLVIRHGETADVREDKAKELIRDGWAEKEGESARKKAAQDAKKGRGVAASPSGRRRSAARPGAPETGRSRAELLGEELNGRKRNPDTDDNFEGT